MIREEAYLLALTKRLYPDIARYYQTTREAVERSIRTLISVMWDKNPELFWKCSDIRAGGSLQRGS